MKKTIELLKKNNELKVIQDKLDIYLEIPHIAYAEVKRRMAVKPYFLKMS